MLVGNNRSGFQPKNHVLDVLPESECGHIGLASLAPQGVGLSFNLNSHFILVSKTKMKRGFKQVANYATHERLV